VFDFIRSFVTSLVKITLHLCHLVSSSTLGEVWVGLGWIGLGWVWGVGSGGS